MYLRLIYLSYRFAHTLETCDAGLKPILEKLFTLYMVSTIEQNLGNLLILGIVKPDQVFNMSKNIFKIDALVKSF